MMTEAALTAALTQLANSGIFGILMLIGLYCIYYMNKQNQDVTKAFIEYLKESDKRNSKLMEQNQKVMEDHTTISKTMAQEMRGMVKQMEEMNDNYRQLVMTFRK